MSPTTKRTSEIVSSAEAMWNEAMLIFHQFLDPKTQPSATTDGKPAPAAPIAAPPQAIASLLADSGLVEHSAPPVSTAAATAIATAVATGTAVVVPPTHQRSLSFVSSLGRIDIDLPVLAAIENALNGTVAIKHIDPLMGTTIVCTCICVPLLSFAFSTSQILICLPVA
jgi:hypothetical protein